VEEIFSGRLKTFTIVDVIKYYSAFVFVLTAISTSMKNRIATITIMGIAAIFSFSSCKK